MGFELKTKETIKRHEELLERFDIFSDLENIKTLNEVFLPKIAAIYKHIGEMEASNNEMRDCISQFDKDLTFKCNKNALKDLRAEIKENFMGKCEIPVIQQKINEIYNEIKRQWNKLDDEIEDYKNKMKHAV